MGRKRKEEVESVFEGANYPIAKDCWGTVEGVPDTWRRPAVLPCVVEIPQIKELREVRILRNYYQGMLDDGSYARINSNMDAVAEVVAALETRLLQEDRRYMLERLMVQHKEGPLVRFKPSKPQDEVIWAVARQMYQKEPVRVKVLKCRQWGASTIATGIIYLCHSLNPHLNGMIISNTDNSATWINGIYRRFWRLDKRPGRPNGNANKDGMVYDDSVGGGSIFITSARFFESALSQTRQYALFDEAAFYPNFRNFMGAAMPIIPTNAQTMVFVVSTPHGLESDFHKFWRKDNDGYQKVFVPWFRVPEYTEKFKRDEDRDEFEKRFANEVDYYGEEDTIKAQFTLTMEQMYWRRITIDQTCQGNLDTFSWMFPATEEEGFLGGGRKFFWFDTAAMYNWAKEQNDKVQRYEVEFDHNSDGVASGAKLTLNRRGRFFVSEIPKPGRSYVIGVDSAGGELIDQANKEPDRSVIQVLQRGDAKKNEETRQVAVWAGHIEPDLLGWAASAISQHYNEAWIAVESNNHGRTVIDHAKIKSKKRLMYEPKKRVGERMDILRPMKARPFGINTNVATRIFMLDELKRGLREGDLRVFDLETLKETETFLINNDGRPEAQQGCFDDRIMALAVAFTAHTKAWIPPLLKGIKGENETMDDIATAARLRKMPVGAFDRATGWNKVG